MQDTGHTGGEESQVSPLVTERLHHSAQGEVNLNLLSSETSVNTGPARQGGGAVWNRAAALGAVGGQGSQSSGGSFQVPAGSACALWPSCAELPDRTQAASLHLNFRQATTTSAL